AADVTRSLPRRACGCRPGSLFERLMCPAHYLVERYGRHSTGQQFLLGSSGERMLEAGRRLGTAVETDRLLISLTRTIQRGFAAVIAPEVPPGRRDLLWVVQPRIGRT